MITAQSHCTQFIWMLSIHISIVKYCVGAPIVETTVFSSSIQWFSIYLLCILWVLCLLLVSCSDIADLKVTKTRWVLSLFGAQAQGPYFLTMAGSSFIYSPTESWDLTGPTAQSHSPSCCTHSANHLTHMSGSFIKMRKCALICASTTSSAYTIVQSFNLLIYYVPVLMVRGSFWVFFWSKG